MRPPGTPPISERERQPRTRRRWSSEEDEVLRKYVAEHGKEDWHGAEKLLKRSGRGCFERWRYGLRSTVAEHPLTDEEKTILWQLYQRFGDSWCAIRRCIRRDNRFSAMRSEFDIKNYIEQVLLERAQDPNRNPNDVNDNDGNLEAPREDIDQNNEEAGSHGN
ncbi:myb-related protein 305-like [Phalaenopsis equestris]|uniref:myb-related protein 305-like n=1 Tax=Phalaenopsis equestris TaxID=78828 RepID=UPI0009E20E76|nr:myb-related protein 305-like [Phalaenopsis equestris]